MRDTVRDTVRGCLRGCTRDAARDAARGVREVRRAGKSRLGGIFLRDFGYDKAVGGDGDVRARLV